MTTDRIVPRPVNRCPGISYQDLLDQEVRPVPDILRLEAPGSFERRPILASRYWSQDFFQLEIDKVFTRTWQYACRIEEIPQPGDTHVFDLVGKSAIILRQDDGGVKAFHNVCLHRGRKLVTHDGCKQALRCQFHGFTWNIDGSFRENPIAWDFPWIEPERFGLRPVRAEVWAGFVFVNFDPEARPLLEELGPIPDHFAHWKIDEDYKAAHVAKVMPSNWKACAEAFLEAHHILATHPQMVNYAGDVNTQYDILSENVSRFISPIGIPSPLLDRSRISEDDIVASMFGQGRASEGNKALRPAPGQTARAFAAEIRRREEAERTGHDDYDTVCDSDILEGISYQFFPNFAIWGGVRPKLGYRWRPWNMDPNSCLMEVFLFKRRPRGENPPPAKMRFLRDDQPWTTATELDYFAGVFDQDVANLGPVQEGLRALGDMEVQFGQYTESRCRHIHHMIDTCIAR